MSYYSITTERPDNWQSIILSKWLRSLKYGNDYFKLIDSDAYFDAYHRYLENILNDPQTHILFALLTDDKDVVLGFSVSKHNVLHYVHVHKDLRRQGIGRSLIPQGIDTISHLTRTGLVVWSNKFPKWKFNPFA